MISKDIRVGKKNGWRSCLVTAPLIAVAVQSACTLCPLQTLLWPFLSNTLQASSSFKQNLPDTFIIASSLIRDPAQIWMNTSHWRLCRTVTHEQKLRHIISVSLLPAWLIDCGCSDTLCRIGILPLIGADTNSSRTAGDRGNRGSTGKWFWWQAPPDVGDTPRMSLCILLRTRLHRSRSRSEMTICRCVTDALRIASDNHSERMNRFED